jgi:uncharacterized membrane protein
VTRALHRYDGLWLTLLAWAIFVVCFLLGAALLTPNHVDAAALALYGLPPAICVAAGVRSLRWRREKKTKAAFSLALAAVSCVAFVFVFTVAIDFTRV